MANINKPSGLSVVRHLQGSTGVGQMNVYYIPSNDTNAYAIGDPVKTLTGAADANGVSAVTLGVAGDGNVLRGGIVGMGGIADGAPGFDPSNLNLTVIPATKAYGYYVMVADDPYWIFEVQEYSGTGSTNFTAADIGKNCNLKAGTNNGYVSGWVLDDTAASATTSTRQVRLLGISRRADNAFGNYCKYLVMINNHEFKAAVAGV
jgi:hypothetical protein